jgi:hypothetical protein
MSQVPSNIPDKLVLEKIDFESKDTFECIVIKPGKISHISWVDKDYLDQLLQVNDMYQSIETNPDNFIQVLAENLRSDDFKINNLRVKTVIVAEERCEDNASYLYQMLYFDLEKNKEFHKEESRNEMAELLCPNEDGGTHIYSNALLFKNKIMSLTDSMTLVTVTKNDIKNILYDRVHTKVVTYDMEDNKWKEERVVGNMENYANQFFEEENYKKIEFGFLMYNINVWYTEATYYPPRSFDRAGASIFEKLRVKKIDKCIWFTMKSDEYRGNLGLEEVEKIKAVAEKLDKDNNSNAVNYLTPSIYTEDKKDAMGRRVIYNKYKVLDLMSLQ